MMFPSEGSSLRQTLTKAAQERRRSSLRSIHNIQRIPGIATHTSEDEPTLACLDSRRGSIHHVNASTEEDEAMARLEREARVHRAAYNTSGRSAVLQNDIQEKQLHKTQGQIEKDRTRYLMQDHHERKRLLKRYSTMFNSKHTRGSDENTSSSGSIFSTSSGERTAKPSKIYLESMGSLVSTSGSRAVFLPHLTNMGGSKEHVQETIQKNCDDMDDAIKVLTETLLRNTKDSAGTDPDVKCTDWLYDFSNRRKSSHANCERSNGQSKGCYNSADSLFKPAFVFTKEPSVSDKLEAADLPEVTCPGWARHKSVPSAVIPHSRIQQLQAESNVLCRSTKMDKTRATGSSGKSDESKQCDLEGGFGSTSLPSIPLSKLVNSNVLGHNNTPSVQKDKNRDF